MRRLHRRRVRAGEPTTTGLAVKALQDALPKARVLYSSATGASEPNNLGYMTRLGTFGYSGMVDMVQNLNKCGPASLRPQHFIKPRSSRKRNVNVFKLH